MNTFYNVIWNEAKNAWVIVSELVTSVKLPKVVAKVAVMTGTVTVAPALLMTTWATVSPSSTATITTKPIEYTATASIHSEYVNANTGKAITAPVYINTPSYTATDQALEAGKTDTKEWHSILIGKGAQILQHDPELKETMSPTGVSYGTVLIGSNATISASPTREKITVIGPAIVIGHNSFGEIATNGRLIDYATPGNTAFHNPNGGEALLSDIEPYNKIYSTVKKPDGTLDALEGSAGVALGANTNIKTLGVAVGPYANTGISGTSIGAYSTASQSGSVALGAGAASVAKNAIAIGRQSAGANANTLAIGSAASAQGAGAMAIGTISTATGEGAIAIGSGLTTNTANAAYAKREVSTTAAGKKSIVMGYNAKSTDGAEHGIALGTNAEASHRSAVAIGADAKTALATAEDAATVNGITYSGFKGEETIAAGGTDVWSFSVGDAGKERQIKNVAPGKVASDSTDAINGSQLYLTQQALGNVAKTVANHLGGGVTVNEDGALSAPTYTLNIANPTAGTNPTLGTVANTVEEGLSNVNTYVNQGFRVLDNGSNLKGTVTPGEAVQFTNGENTMATVTEEADGITKVSYNLAKDLQGINSIAGGHTTISFGDTVKVDGGNLDLGGNKITNLAPGTAPTDGVNKSQLDQAITNIVNLGNREVAQAGSHAGAMAALKVLQYDPLEPTQIMGGVAHYKGETAAALGLAHFTHENTMLHVGVSLGHGDNMVAGGVSHKFGWSPEKKAIPERYQGGPISSIYVMQDEMTALRAENVKQQARIDQQERLVEAQQRTMEVQQRNMEAQQRHIESQQRDIEELKQLVNTLMGR